LFSEDFFADPDATLAQVVRFMGLPPARIDASHVYNKGARSAVDGTLTGRLWEGYQASIAELEALLGRRAPWSAP
jgi:hypothetical protein